MHDLPHQLEIYKQAFSTPFHIKDKKLSGCLYSQDGAKIALSERFGGWKGDWFPSDNPKILDRPGNLEMLSGKSLYLGHYMKHYGHFITESLSPFWIFDYFNAENFDHIVFHAFTFGEDIPAWAEFFLASFGVPLDRVVILKDTPCQFEELYVPERLFRLNHSADPDLIAVHRKISDMCRFGSPAEAPGKLYLSRRRQNLKARRRLIANEYQVENEFKRRGFTVLYPETIPVREQIRLYANAEVIAGPSGSALHNILFTQPGTILVELADPRYAGKPAPNQEVCNVLAGARPVFVPFKGRIVGTDMVLLLDQHALGRHLEANAVAALEVMEQPLRPSLSSVIKGVFETAFHVARARARELLPKKKKR